MSEYRTLKEWFGDATRGDGRKFYADGWSRKSWFEPAFITSTDQWYGLDENGLSHCPYKERKFYLWTPPVVKKKVTLYRVFFPSTDGQMYFTSAWEVSLESVKRAFPESTYIETKEIEINE